MHLRSIRVALTCAITLGSLTLGSFTVGSLTVGSISVGALTMIMPQSMAVAQTPLAPESLETARGLGMGTGVRSSAAATSAVAYNPSALPFARVYHLDGFARYSADAHRWSVGTTVADSMVNQKLAAGLSFRGLLDSGSDEGYSGFDGRAAVAFPLSNALALGLSGRYLSFTSEGQGPDGEEAGASLAKGFTVDGSITAQPVPGLRLSGLGLNLIDMNSSLAPTMVGGSASYVVEEVFTLGADFLVDLTTFEKAKLVAGGGAEYLAGGQVPVRMGYAYDAGRHLHTMSGGLGYVESRVGVDIALSQDVRGGSDTQIMGSITYFAQ